MKTSKILSPSKENLALEFNKAGLKLSPKQLENFWFLHELLESRNPKGDLTRISGFYNLVYKHYIDGAIIAKMIDPPPGLLMDIGTGAGFPGLPLALMRPDLQLLLAEPRGRKLEFMEEIVEGLKLANVEFYPHKVGPRFDRAIQNFITRDFESVAESMKRAAQILPLGGQMILMKGPGVNNELKEAGQLAEWPQFKLLADKAYDLGSSGIKRRLLIFEKKSKVAKTNMPTDENTAENKKTNYKILEIASRENGRYKSWLKLLEGRGLRRAEAALISGQKFIKEILDQNPEKVLGLIAKRQDDLQGLNIPQTATVYLVRAELFPALDLFNTKGPFLLLATDPLPPWEETLAHATVFLPLQEPGNLGTAIRSAAAFDLNIVLLKEAASPWHPKALRAAGSAIAYARLFQGPSLAELGQMPLNILALSPQGQNIFKAQFPTNVGLVAGIEGPGLDAYWPPEKRLSIPMNPKIESLNTAQALAMALAVWRLQEEKQK